MSDPRIGLAQATAQSMSIAFGADFTVYGPISYSKEAYLSAALADAYVAYFMMQEYGIRPKVKKHPLFRIWELE